MSVDFEVSPFDIVMYHIGGTRGFGPTDGILNNYPKRLVLVCFEANCPQEEIDSEQKFYAEQGIRYIIIPRCIGEEKGKRNFYINTEVPSSSIFPPAKQALDEWVQYSDKVKTWGDNCVLDRIEEVEMYPLDDIIKEFNLPLPDILSMDAQGAELQIMKGAKKCVDENVLFIQSEIEFFEIYEGQDLFSDQLPYLLERDFRLGEITSQQYWQTAEHMGKGMETVGEAIWFRNFKPFVDKFSESELFLSKLIKLAAIADVFNRKSYAKQLLSIAVEKYGDEAKAIISEESYNCMLELI